MAGGGRLLLLLRRGGSGVLLGLDLVEMGRQPMLTIRMVSLALRLLRLVTGKRRLRWLRVGRD